MPGPHVGPFVNKRDLISTEIALSKSEKLPLAFCLPAILGKRRPPYERESQIGRKSGRGVVGYSRLARADEDRTPARLWALRSDLIDPTIAVYNGALSSAQVTGHSSSSAAWSMPCAAPLRCRTLWAQPVMVVDGLVSQGDGRDAPPDQRAHCGPCKPQRGVNKARRHPLEQANDFVDMAKQKRAGIETSHNFVAVEAFKFELRGDTA